MAKNFYAPAILSAIQDEKGKVEIYLTSDNAKAKKAKVNIQVSDFTGKATFEENISVTVPAGGAKLLRSYELAKLTPKPDSHFMTLKMDIEGEIFRNEHFFCAWKKCELPKTDVKVKVKTVKEGFEIMLEASKPAFYVGLFAEGICGEFEDNCFTLLPDEKRTVPFKPRSNVTTDVFKKTLYIKHLRETYA